LTQDVKPAQWPNFAHPNPLSGFNFFLMRALTPVEFNNAIGQDDTTIILDCRDTDSFAEGHIPGAIFIPLNNQFEDWVTSLLPSDREILLVCDEVLVTTIKERLEKTGRPAPIGWLSGGFDAWRAAGQEFHLVIRVEADELAMDLPYDERLLVVDVRTEAEFAEGHVRDSMNIPMRSLSDTMTLALIEEEQHLYICGASDEKSMMAASVLMHQGYLMLRTVDGGWEAVRKQKGIPVEKETDKLN
jgi:rhodanese-related sulfurtransferase